MIVRCSELEMDLRDTTDQAAESHLATVRVGSIAVGFCLPTSEQQPEAKFASGYRLLFAHLVFVDTSKVASIPALG